MLSLLYLLVFSVLCSWLPLTLSLMTASILSVCVLNSYFSSTQNMMLSSSGLSTILVSLSCFLCLLALLGFPEEKQYKYSILIIVLANFLCIAFLMSNIMMFYVFFEASLIPTLMLIIGWGYQPERLQAGSYMMLYTVGASLPLLVALLYQTLDSSTALIWMLNSSSSTFCSVPALIFYGAFLVKLPMYSVHLWLPKAHVEAPLAGSMILAGILLKLGGYGIIQMNICFTIYQSWMVWMVVGISMWGGLLSTLLCLRQVDIKSLVAYSSVGHMGIVSSGFILGSSWGVTSAIVTMVAHGLSSSALFCLAYFSYKKVHSRSIPYMKGFLQLYPALSLFWFIFCCVNMAAPPTLNLLGEMQILPSLWSGHIFLVVVMAFMIFMSAAYNMYLYSSINHGGSSQYMSPSTPLYSFEYMVLFAHLIPTAVLFKSSLFIL